MLKHIVGKRVTSLRRILRSHGAGQGGSAAISGLFVEWGLPYKSGGMLLGPSIYDPGWIVGITDDRHCLTIASNRSGKGRSAIIPALLTWPGSALVVDPKGTNALVTGARRGKGGHRVRKGMGQKVFALNPFAVNKGVPGMPLCARFNPLSILDASSDTFYEDLEIIADALVVPSSNDPFWDQSAKSLLRALIGFVFKKYGNKGSLIDVRDVLTEISDPKSPTVAEMLKFGGVIADAAAQISAAEDRLRSGIIATALHHTDWLGSKAMQDALCASDFTLADLKDGLVTVYLILPPEYLETHARFLRLFVNLMVKAASMQGRSKTPILFLLDEFYSLGPMTSLAKAVGNLAGYNVKLWPILQNLSQLVELYPQNWEGFISSAGFLQVFGINDAVTAQYVTQKLGRTVIYRDDQFGNRVPAGAVDLRDHVEITQEASRISGKQIVFREGDDPLVLARLNYDSYFPRNQFNPDIDY